MSLFCLPVFSSLQQFLASKQDKQFRSPTIHFFEAIQQWRSFKGMFINYVSLCWSHSYLKIIFKAILKRPQKLLVQQTNWTSTPTNFKNFANKKNKYSGDFLAKTENCEMTSKKLLKLYNKFKYLLKFDFWSSKTKLKIVKNRYYAYIFDYS